MKSKGGYYITQPMSYSYIVLEKTGTDWLKCDRYAVTGFDLF